MNCPCFVIHRQKDVEREDIVKELEKEFPTLLRMEAIDGNGVDCFPRMSVDGLSFVTDGVVGCMLSHLMLIQKALRSHWSHICIFEDDAVIQGDYKAFYESHKDCDILYFGVLHVLEGDKKVDCWQVRDSWGTHAVVLNRTAMKAIQETFYKVLDEGFFYGSDNLYSRAITDFGLVAYAPHQPLIDQKKGLQSTLSDSVRT